MALSRSTGACASTPEGGVLSPVALAGVKARMGRADPGVRAARPCWGVAPGSRGVMPVGDVLGARPPVKGVAAWLLPLAYATLLPCFM